MRIPFGHIAEDPSGFRMKLGPFLVDWFRDRRPRLVLGIWRDFTKRITLF